MISRITAFLFILTFSICSFSTNLTPLEFRLSFQKAIEDEDLCLKFISDLEHVEPNNYIYRAYRAAAVMSLAKFTSYPTEKLHYFYKGKSDIELAIKKMPTNTELRFLRLAVQDYIPGFLFYNNQEEDLAFLLSNLGKIDEVFYVSEVKNYLIYMGHIQAIDLLSMK